jgi:hypothetical protein
MIGAVGNLIVLDFCIVRCKRSVDVTARMDQQVARFAFPVRIRDFRRTEPAFVVRSTATVSGDQMLAAFLGASQEFRLYSQLRVVDLKSLELVADALVVGADSPALSV